MMAGRRDAAGDLDEPVFNMAFDKSGQLWATTGGGPLLLLDAQTGQVRASFGDSLTQTLAVDPDSGMLYVSSGRGIEIFDPVKHTFTHFSDVRVDDLAFSPNGELWGTSWPVRGDILKFNDKGVPRSWFTSTENGFNCVWSARQPARWHSSCQRGGHCSSGTELVAIDTTTLQQVVVALKAPGAIR